MLVERTFDAKFINAVANSDDCLGGLTVGSMEAIDYTPVVKDMRNVVMVGQHGGFVFHRLLPGLYEVHSQVLKPGRGAWALSAVQESVRYLFTQTEAMELVTRVPEGNNPARSLTLAMGGVAEGVLDSPKLTFSWTMYRLTIQDWMQRAPGLVEMGEWFHHRLHQEYETKGIKAPIHDEDEFHNRYVGAAAYMVLGRQPLKGISFYNRWAAMALAPFAAVISTNPLVIDIRDVKLLVSNGDFEVLDPCPAQSSQASRPH